MPLPRVALESLLRARSLDRTLTTAIPIADPHDAAAIAPTGITALDAHLGGGFPRGQLSELIGSRSSGRTSLMLQMLAAATARGELAALIDALDMVDVESAAAAGVDLTRLLWVRGLVVTNPGMCRDLNQRALEQSIRALALVLQAGNFGLIVFDAAEAPPDALRRLPFTTWLRLQRMVEGSPTACVLVGNDAMARSSAGLTVCVGRGLGPCDKCHKCQKRQEGQECLECLEASAAAFGPRLFKGLSFEARIQQARSRLQDNVRVPLSTAAV
jgi:hypothetical protein